MSRRPATPNERGATLVEFAIIAPVVFLVMFAVVEAGLMFQSWVTVQHAAQSAARYAVTGRDTCTSGGYGRESCIISEARRGASSLRNGSSATVAVRSWAFPAYTSVTNGSAGAQCDAVEVQVRHTHQVMTPIISTIVHQVTLTGTQRFLNEPFGRCLG